MPAFSRSHENWQALALRAGILRRDPRPFAAGAIFSRGDIETWGRGIRRIFEACRAAGQPEPRIRSLANDLWLEFPFAPDYLAAIAASTPVVTPEVARLLSVVSGEHTRRDLQATLGLRDDGHMREAYLLPALAAGVLERTIPDKPHSVSRNTG